MSVDLFFTPPPDNTGTDTLIRYKYQAALAFRYCLACVLGEDVRCVIMEHFEDFIVQYSDRWDFLQVKTRNPDLGAWTVANAAGGIESLYRTYSALKEIGKVNGFRLQLLLEGAIKAGDILKELTTCESDRSKDLVDRVGDILNVSLDEVARFLAFVQVVPVPISRESVHDVNKGMLSLAAPDMKGREIATIYIRVLDDILAAMSADRDRQGIYRFIREPESAEVELAAQVRAKRIDHTRLNAYMGRVTSGTSPLLKRFTDDGNDRISILVKKLLVARATESIVKRAIMLRANATSKQIELASSKLYWDFEPKLEDVRERIGTLNDSVVALHLDKDRPAVDAWNDLLNRLMNPEVAQNIDPNGLFDGDPFLLMGLNCDIADQCFTDWGVKLA